MSAIENRHLPSIGWVCPLCFSPLQMGELADTGMRVNNSWRCGAGHCFDEAKQGYLNLLPVQKKGSLSPGDNSDMIAARHRFLQAGYYQRLSTELNCLAFRELLESEYDESDHVKKYNKYRTSQIVDIGCGEGYYLHELLNTMRLDKTVNTDTQASSALNQELLLKSYGIDISKAAIKRAAVNTKEAQFAVASSHNIPLADQSCDLAFTVFAPVNSKELKRILTKKGCFIRVSPGPRHLYELKSRLYKEVKLHDCPKELSGFTQTKIHNLEFELILKDKKFISDFLLMTPLNWNKSQEAKNLILENDIFKVSCDFLINVYKPNE